MKTIIGIAGIVLAIVIITNQPGSPDAIGTGAEGFGRAIVAFGILVGTYFLIRMIDTEKDKKKGN